MSLFAPFDMSARHFSDTIFYELSGTTTLHEELEEVVANFVGKPAALVFGMGYVTNSAILPVLIGKVCYDFFKNLLT